MLQEIYNQQELIVAFVDWLIAFIFLLNWKELFWILTVSLGEEINTCREGSYLRAKISIFPSQCKILEVSLSFSSFFFAFAKL